ncbi:MAG: hypothetical protein UX60_C0001G0011 [Berkelbacteria bacterium GW2011_GWA2_46_7]|uniref:Uncharacterized protein n=1 Tax=Berkelbacteria bacterium GW2011_GWA2_46_7 TaxID=1618335 RepID=A0A0G1SRF5_9BACT|nr:MAG: hypothetical protein UX60_C0001G0011 [Berkelbacteria bacterium GW2011_GWA2_46_7]
MFTNEDYFVEVDGFAERHYIKVFAKKYGSKKWNITLSALTEEAKRIDRLISETNRAEIITSGSKKVVKISFKVAGTNESAKTSGNRAIVYVDEENRTVLFLLVYCKNDIGPPNETQKWQKMIKDQYPNLLS